MRKHMASLCLAIVITFSFFMASCGNQPTEKESAQQEMYRKEHQRNTINEILRDRIYFRDHQTDICYMYFWGGAGNGGPALATVDCEKVKNLLIN